MSQQVGLLYGKPRVRKLVVSAGTDVNSIALRYSTETLGAGYGASVSEEISPGTAVIVGATIPGSSISNTTSYHDGDTPSQGNYYYNEVTNYRFDKWVDEKGNTKAVTATYSFDMPTEELTLIANATSYITEANIVPAVGITVVNNSSSNLKNVVVNGSTFATSGTIYRWSGQGDITITGTPKDYIVSQEQFSSGSSTASSGNSRWFVGTTYVVNKIIAHPASGSDTTFNSGTISVNPTQDMTYSISGISSQGTVSSSNAKSTTYTDNSYSNNGASSTTWMLRTTKWFWNNSSETVSTSQSTESVSTTVKSTANVYINSSGTASNAVGGSGQSVSKYETVQYSTINGVAQNSQAITTSYFKSYVSVASAAAGPTLTGGATSTKYTKRSTSWYTGSGAETAPSVYSTNSSSAYTSEYLSTYPLTGIITTYVSISAGNNKTTNTFTLSTGVSYTGNATDWYGGGSSSLYSTSSYGTSSRTNNMYWSFETYTYYANNGYLDEISINSNTVKSRTGMSYKTYTKMNCKFTLIRDSKSWSYEYNLSIISNYAQRIITQNKTISTNTTTYSSKKG